MLPALLSLGAIAAVVLLLIGIFGETPDPSAGGDPDEPDPAVTSTTAPGTTTPVTSAPPTTPTTAITTTTPPPPPPPTIPADVDVVVLNSTSVAGLASRVTDHLASLGWSTATPDNFAPALEQTTVYYPEGQEAVARLLAAAAPGAADVVALVIPEVAADAFTVVLGADAADWVAPESTTPTSPTG